ncbi:hypothetical protein [Streptomyces sp. NPDC059787]|uniref:hypothetical protein n=1 Tax=Streptomyces sp. NPDC059787 TaxID=3346947 RepID=UPI003667255B
MSTEDLPENPAEWSEPERQLVLYTIAGQELDLGSGDPRYGENWGPERTIRASVVRRLLTDRSLGIGIGIGRLRLKGAKIAGQLDLVATTLNGTLELVGCHVSEVIKLEQATAPAIYLKSCYLAGFQAGQLHTTHNVKLTDSTSGFVVLTAARIDGQLDLQSTVLLGRTERPNTLSLSGISIGSDATLQEIQVVGATNMIGAKVNGQLNFRKARLEHRGGCALKALELETKEAAHFDEGFYAEGSMDLTGSLIGGSLYLNRATIHHPGKDPALDLARATIRQNMHCGNGFSIQGQTWLAGAVINGSLLASGGEFIHPSDTAIDASGIKVGRDIILGLEQSESDADRNGFRAIGKVVLADAVINGSLKCEGGTITDERPIGEALNARGVKVTRDLLLSGGFNATGKVVLTGADVGSADWGGGSFGNSNRTAISARQLKVGASLLFAGDFLARGEVDLSGATINGRLLAGGQIYCGGKKAMRLDRVTVAQDVEFESGFLVEGTLYMRSTRVGANLKISKPNLSRGKGGLVLSLEGTVVTGTLILEADAPVSGGVDLRQAKARFLEDSENFWPERKVSLAGFTYDSLADIDSPDVEGRIRWLSNEVEYSAQSYEQLASVYRVAGRDDFARDVLYAGQKRRPRPGWREKSWSWLLRLTVGYGYHPARVLYAVLLLEVFGCIYFSHLRHELKPSSALLSAYDGKDAEAKEHLQPALYTLDLLLPVVPFGQRALWLPQGGTSWVVTGLMVVGWVLGGILVYGIGTAYQRRSS